MRFPCVNNSRKPSTRVKLNTNLPDTRACQTYCKTQYAPYYMKVTCVRSVVICILLRHFSAFKAIRACYQFAILAQASELTTDPNLFEENSSGPGLGRLVHLSFYFCSCIKRLYHGVKDGKNANQCNTERRGSCCAC